MADVGLASALLLAGVLAWAGVVKARQPQATAASFAALGLPAPAVLARAVPVVELTVALALAARPGDGAVAALGLLAAFTAVLFGAVRGGEGVACACFGSASTEPVSGMELARNGLLLVAGALALAAPVRGPLAGGPPPALPAVLLVGAVAVACVLGFALARLRRDVGAVWSNRLAGEGS